MDKSPEAFRTISEVAEALETPAHVLRFWESRFPQIRPVKRAGGRRYYRPADVALLTGYSADVEVLLEQRPQVLRIPTESLLDGNRVLRYDAAAGVLREVPVTAGLANWHWTEISEGLQAGDRIIVSLDQEGLGDGVRVTPVDTAKEPAE